MKNKSLLKKENIWVFISPWFIIAAIAVLLPLFIYLTLENINKQREYTTKLLVEKGAALIRSFEAGARTGVGMRWSGFQLQKLLIETAQQPGIDYLVVTDLRGTILADSDPSLIGESYGTELDLVAVSKIKNVQWRRVAKSDGVDTFEVYRRFAPLDARFETFHGRISSKYKRYDDQGSLGYIIFVGLDMEPIEKARAEDLNHAIFMGVILLLIGFSGIVMLLLAQGYQSTKTSLSRIKAFSDSLVDHMPIGLIAIDQKGAVISINQSAENILYLSASEVLNKEASEVLPMFIKDLTQELKTGGRVIEKELDCPAGGQFIRLDVVAAILEEEDGAFMGYVILFRDITEVQQLKREIARTQRLASIGSLASGIAHEIRNPLSSIKGFATYFRERYRDVPEDRNTADIMVREVERLNRVITQLLTFTRPLSLEKKRQSLQPIISHSLKLIERQTKEKNITIKTDVPAGVREVLIDKDAMEQALLNLFLNAVEAMDAGGVLSVSLTDTDAVIRIEIADTGRGIEEKDLERLFDLYFTTKQAGTGLGLPIVQKIMDAHDGDIKIAGEPGRGTIVTLLLPAEG
ncbi:MAG: PAS domain S-box protein [Deltaproteobacteria bacterium]|nr:PAS domain S-box protein [Deltaproteobacteria bacterium]